MTTKEKSTGTTELESTLVSELAYLKYSSIAFILNYEEQKILAVDLNNTNYKTEFILNTDKFIPLTSTMNDISFNATIKELEVNNLKIAEELISKEYYNDINQSLYSEENVNHIKSIFYKVTEAYLSNKSVTMSDFIDLDTKYNLDNYIKSNLQLFKNLADDEIIKSLNNHIKNIQSKGV